MLKENKTIIIIFALVIIALFLFVMFRNASNISNTSNTTASFATKDNSINEGDMLRMLTEMKNIRLDGRIFKDESYLNLQDFSREIMSEPIGRVDPFAPLENTGVTISGGESISGQVLLR